MNLSMKLPSIVVLSLSISMLGASCGRQETYVVPATGSYSGVVLVTETGALEGPTVAMVDALQVEIDYYTRTELEFRVKVVSAADFEKEVPTRNMVLFGVVNRGRIGTIIGTFIGDEGTRSVLQGQHNIFARLDSPVKGQLTVIVTGVSNDDLERLARQQGGVIREIIEDADRQRIRDYIFKVENTSLEGQLRAKYGFTMQIPGGQNIYTLSQDRPEVPGIEIAREGPHRGLGLSWREWTEDGVSVADSNALYAFRADFAYKMYDKDVMKRDLVSFREVQLGVNKAIRMQGYWENSVEPYGGAFVCFFVYDHVKSRLWLIDCLTYAPGQNRHELFRELIAIAETFKL
jgi:hypothetical protein